MQQGAAADRKLIKKLEKQNKFDPILERPVDVSKIKSFDLISNWVENKLQELLGKEDEILSAFIMNTLQREGQEGTAKLDMVDGKLLQVQLTGFLRKDAPVFTALLWKYMLDITTPRPAILIQQRPAPPQMMPMAPVTHFQPAIHSQPHLIIKKEQDRSSWNRNQYRDRNRDREYNRERDRDREYNRERDRRGGDYYRRRSRSRSRSRSRDRGGNRGTYRGRHDANDRQARREYRDDVYRREDRKPSKGKKESD
jgi:hypothetical protein